MGTKKVRDALFIITVLRLWTARHNIIINNPTPRCIYPYDIYRRIYNLNVGVLAYYPL